MILVMRKNVETQNLGSLAIPDRHVEHVWYEEDDEGNPHEKDDCRWNTSLQLILPLPACIYIVT